VTSVAPEPGDPPCSLLVSSIRTIRVIHVNVVHEDFDAAVEHYGRVYGGMVVKDIPQPAWHACLLDIGRVLFEIFAPHDFFLHRRYGPHLYGIEYQVEDMEEVRAVIASRGIRVARELGVALHTNAADCHGVSLEFFDGYFHDNDEVLDTPMRPPEYWRDDHPLGLTGLRGCTVAVTEMAQAVEDFGAVFHHEVLYEDARPAVGATAVGLHIGDAVLELLAPTGDGPLQQHLIEHGEGIRSTVFAVRDLDRARSCLRDHGIEMVPGAAPDTLAVPAEQNLGVVFEFCEQETSAQSNSAK
jgi:hypothetical protein